MNFKQRFKDTTHIFTLKRLLREKHGRIEDLKICFHEYSEPNEVSNEMLNLRECGLTGQHLETKLTAAGELEIDEKALPTVQVFYDFKPANNDEAVLLYFKKV